MIGKTNIPMGMSKGETVSILLKTNQSSNEDLNGVKVVVSYDDESHEYSYNGQFSVEIPKDKTYTVTFGEVDGYKTPSSVTYTAVKGFSRSVEAMYYSEFVTVNVSTEDGINVDNKAYIYVSTFDSLPIPIVNGTATFNIPYDETYTVSLSDMDGYTAPESQSYTASQPTREISMEYKKAVEHLVVNVSSDDNAVSGYEINIFKPEYEYIGENNEYLKLDYIESTGKQWIDTGYKPSALMRMEFDVQFTSTKGGYNGLYLTNKNLAFGANSNLEFYFSDSFETVSSNVTERNSIVFNTAKGDVLLNNSSIIKGVSYYEPNYSLPIFALMGSSGVDSYAYMKLYSFKIYRSSELERNYIPAMRMSDGIVGLYEELNGDFLQSETGVNFKAGFVGYVIGTQTSATGEYDIPLGTEYMITASDVKGYTTPASQTFTAESGTRTVDMVYEAVKLGVFIQGVSGKLYETDAWASQETPNGIAVLTENCRFVMALEVAYSSQVRWASNNYISPNGVTYADSLEEAKLLYDGKANTNATSSESSSRYPAFYRCRMYSFPNGQKGYLGAAGEWQAVLDNFVDVMSAYNRLDLTFTTSAHWTSTMGDTNARAWYATVTEQTSNRILRPGDKTSSYFVRAFTTI